MKDKKQQDPCRSCCREKLLSFLKMKPDDRTADAADHVTELGYIVRVGEGRGDLVADIEQRY